MPTSVLSNNLDELDSLLQVRLTHQIKYDKDVDTMIPPLITSPTCPYRYPNKSHLCNVKPCQYYWTLAWQKSSTILLIVYVK